MPRFRHHVFICENLRPEDDPRGSCGAKGSASIRQAFKSELKARNLKGVVRANASGCPPAPPVVVSREGVGYGGVPPADVPEIVESHLVGGRPVERLRIREYAA